MKRNNIKKYLTILTMALLTIGIISGCGHEHTWTEATCIAPKTCSECGETESTALGHSWTEATCTAPKTCSECGETEGTALGHTWTEATCTAPKTCSECGETEGTALGHTWIEATCINPKICNVCEETEGIELGHLWIEATCEEPMFCGRCGLIEGNPLGHLLDETTGRCSRCKRQIAISLDADNYYKYLSIDSKLDGSILRIIITPVAGYEVKFHNVVLMMELILQTKAGGAMYRNTADVRVVVNDWSGAYTESFDLARNGFTINSTTTYSTTFSSITGLLEIK